MVHREPTRNLTTSEMPLDCGEELPSNENVASFKVQSNASSYTSGIVELSGFSRMAARLRYGHWSLRLGIATVIKRQRLDLINRRATARSIR